MPTWITRTAIIIALVRQVTLFALAILLVLGLVDPTIVASLGAPEAVLISQQWCRRLLGIPS